MNVFFCVAAVVVAVLVITNYAIYHLSDNTYILKSARMPYNVK